MAHPSLEDIENELETDMDMRGRHAARRNRGDVYRELGGADVLGRHALLVVDAVPVSPRATTPNGEQPAVIFHRAKLDFVLLVLHGESRLAEGRPQREA